MGSITRDRLEAAVSAIGDISFDVPFTIDRNAEVRVRRDSLYVPEVAHDPTSDVMVTDDDWTPLTGLTGQWSYSGAVMHPSEYVGPGVVLAMLEHIATPEGTATFALTEVRDEDLSLPEGDAIGWAILHYAPR